MTGIGKKNVEQPPTAVRPSALCSFSRPRAGGPHSGFTLIEVMTAVALTAGLMLGVIEIFKMSSDAATQTEQASDAFEMGRGVMAQIESDLTMFAPEGYLWVRCQEMDPKFWAGTEGLVNASISNSSQVAETARYRFDGLSFSVAMSAPTAAQLATSSGGTKTNPVNANGCTAGGQVAYTFGQRISAVPSYNTPSKTYSPYMGTLNNSDQRGVVLVRKVYLDQSFLNPLGTGQQLFLGYGTNGTLTGGLGNGNAMTQNTSMVQAATEYLTTSPLTWVLAPNFRLSPTSFYHALNASYSSYWQPIINVPDPSVYNSTTNQSTGNLCELDNIVCDRVSEFFVEVWNGHEWVPNGAKLPASGGGGADYTFTGNTPSPNYIAMTNVNESITQGTGGSWTSAGGGGYAPPPTPTTAASRWSATAGGATLGLCPDSTTAIGQVTLLRDNMLWLGTAANPINRYDVTGFAPPSTAPADLPPATMPSMVRVTLVVHPHADTTPLASESYDAGLGPARYQGVVFREVFKLSGTVR